MYKKPKYIQATIHRNSATEGERIESKIERIINNKEKIEGTAPLIYTERSEGVGAGYNIRTDRFELAVEAKDKVHRSAIARRESKAEMTVLKSEKGEESGNHETTQGTN